MTPSFRQEPFLWIHLSGIALVPVLWLLLTLALAMGTPFPVYGLEILALVAIALAPVVLMQLVKPFEIFSILIVALRPDSLTVEQRQILTLFKRPSQRNWVLLGLVISVGMLGVSYWFSPVASYWVQGLPDLRPLGLGLAAIAYGLLNLFLQVPLSVAAILLTPKETVNQTVPLDPAQIPTQFTIPGVKLRKIPLIPPLKSPQPQDS